ncbi:FAD:protein FMN transferase [Tunturiibacter empetritectus]|uniref:FAD:protein FMN transferase n=1 Tax=Tunturiibacter lichenicola TaxID=2051959 RepID=A0A852VLX5_9BACT|nr:FAD:protein FMN transferase [Edaphobacter lichenicola]NYF91095.1 thiamine biosynthesis lipoprotein [Edaphobacter lichenicola]
MRAFQQWSLIAEVALLFGAASVLAQPTTSSEALYTESRPAMGTVFTIKCYMPDRESADEVMDAAFEEINRLEALLSNYQPSSELSRISRESGSGPVVTDPETFGFLAKSFDWSDRSHGAFDITVGPLLRAWGFKARNGHVPTQAEQKLLRDQVGWDKVKLDPATNSVRFTTHNPMELDPGSIGKGFAVDSVVALLRESGVHAAFLSAGGSTLYGLGAPPGKAGWPVEVPDPRTAGSIATTFLLHDTSLSTGACTEKFFIQNGHRYCHIFDPRTLMPVEGVLQSTVIAPSATDSDALSTVVFVLPPAQTREVLRGLQGTQAILFLSAPGAPTCIVFGAPDSACDAHMPATRKGVRP